MNLWNIYKELELLAAVYGWDTQVMTGGPDGDTIEDVWYEEDHGTIYIH